MAENGNIRTVALLAPGPTLRFFGPDMAAEYDAVIAVNRAAAFLAKRLPGASGREYAILLDAYTWSLIPWGRDDFQFHRISVVTYMNEWNRLRDARPETHDCGGITIEAIAESVEGDCRLAREDEWRTFGVTVGLALAVHLGAVRIDCFGVDQHGEKDFDGFSDARQKRSPRRWGREKRIWAKVTRRVAALGIRIRRIAWHEERTPLPEIATAGT